MKTVQYVAFACILAMMLVDDAVALEFPGPFKIKSIFVSGATNLHYRVISDNPASWQCHNGPTYDSWAYINENDDGAKGKIAAIQMAYALGKSIRLITEGVWVPWGTGTICHIIELQLY